MSDPPFHATAPRSNRRQMTLVTESEIPDPPAPPNPTPTTPSSTTSATASPTRIDADELISRAAWQQGLLGALATINRVLAARAILMIAVLGAIGLAYEAVSESDILRLIALAVYLVAGLGPLVWLSSRS